MENKKLSIREIIAFTCTFISVSASLRSMYVSNESLKLSNEGIRLSTENLKMSKAAKDEERLNQKPTLAMTLSRTCYGPESPQVCFAITLQNIGHRNAYELRTVSYLMKKDKKGRLKKMGTPILSSASELAIGTFSTSRYPVKQPRDVQYLVTAVTYKDRLLNRTFTQKFVRKWYDHELVIPQISEQNMVLTVKD